MSPTIDAIKGELAGSRGDLRSNLEELGERLKSALDWRKRVRSNPGAAFAIAFGGGVILAAAVAAARGTRADRIMPRQGSDLSLSEEGHKGHVLRAWDEIQQALVGVVAAKVAKTLAQAIPGFKEQLAARRGDASDRPTPHKVMDAPR